MEDNLVKAPTSKHQHPENLQVKSSTWCAGGGGLDVEVWIFSGAWMLELGAFSQ
jgi:hypothetical protein